MATPRNLTQFAFAAGIDEAQQAEVLEPSAGFTRLENVRQDKRGALSKRLGFTSLASTRLDGTSRSAGRKVFGHGSAVCTVDGSKVDAYSEALSRWVDKGRLPEATARVLDAQSIVNNAARIVDVSYCNGVTVFAQADTATLTLTTQDANGVQLIADQSYASTVYGGLASYGNYVVSVTASDTSADVVVRYLDCTSAATVAAGWTAVAAIASAKLATGAAAAKQLAVLGLDDRVTFALINNTGGANQVTVTQWSVASGVIATTTVNTGGVTPTAVGIGGSSSDTLWIAWNEAAAVRIMGVSPTSIGTTVAATASILLTSAGVTYVTIGAGHATGRGRVFVLDGVTTYTRGFQTSAGVAASDGALATYPSVILLSRPIRRSDRYYAACCQFHDVTATTSEFILCDFTEAQNFARPVASVEPGLVIPSDGYRVPAIVARSASAYVTPIHLLRSGAVRASMLVEYDFADTARWAPVSHGGITYLSGGVLSKFSGGNVREAACLARPLVPQVTAAAGALSPVVGYRWVATFETADEDGNWIVSSVSNPSDLSGTTANRQYTVTSTALSITMMTSGHRVSFYRTEDGGTTYYYVDSVASSPGTTPSVVDATTDATLRTRAKLYGTGALPGTGAGQDRRAPPGLARIVSYGDMLVGATGAALHYSSQPVVGEGIWFNPIFRIDMVDGGDVTALAAQDGTLYVFKRDAIFAVTGEAPSDNGATGGLGTPRKLAVDAGCTDARSVVVTALGVFFQSARGIELLSRAQSVEWIGEAVHATLASYPVITAATLDQANALVRFECAASETSNAVSDTGVSLVYDLTLRAWVSVDKVYAEATASRSAQSACMAYLGGAWRYVRLDKNGSVHYERAASDGSAHLDGSTWVTMLAETSWLKLGGIQGSQFVNRLQWLSRKSTRADYSLSLAYDYATSYKTEATWAANAIDTLSSAIGRVQLEHPLHDEAEGVAVRALLQDATPTGGTVSTGKGATWIALTFEGTARDGATDLPDTAR